MSTELFLGGSGGVGDFAIGTFIDIEWEVLLIIHRHLPLRRLKEGMK